MKVAMACNKAAPSTMGTLVSSGIMAVAKAWKGKEQVGDAELAAVPRQFADAMMARGKAQVGDKTILDALVPMAEAVETEFAQSGDLAAAFAAGRRLPKREPRRPAACWQKPDAPVGSVNGPGRIWTAARRYAPWWHGAFFERPAKSKTKPGASLGFRRVFAK